MKACAAQMVFSEDVLVVPLVVSSPAGRVNLSHGNLASLKIGHLLDRNGLALLFSALHEANFLP